MTLQQEFDELARKLDFTFEDVICRFRPDMSGHNPLVKLKDGGRTNLTIQPNGNLGYKLEGQLAGNQIQQDFDGERRLKHFLKQHFNT